MKPNPFMPNVTTPKVINRNAEVVPWNRERIRRAISLAFFAMRHPGINNTLKESKIRNYGLSPKDVVIVEALTTKVEEKIITLGVPEVSLETIQDTVEDTLLENKHIQIAKAYISYRQTQAITRLKHYDGQVLSDYIFAAKYARYNPEKKRREVWDETVDRVRDMHLTFFADKLDAKVTLEEQTKTLKQWIEFAFEGVRRKEVLPSMRSLQFGGEAVLKANSRLYNCSYSFANRPAWFREYFYLLLCGCGCGFSVQTHHVAQLPSLPPRSKDDELPVRHYAIPDTIEGWADSLDVLLESYLKGYYVEFNYSQIRRKGTPLKTSGGKAPGHVPLKKMHVRVNKILAEAAGRHLKPIEVYDIAMFIAEAVLSGGIRRSAVLTLFSPADEEMMNAKTGDWFNVNRQRSGSNNSAVIIRNKTTREQFDKLFHAQKEFGEPGFFFADSTESGSNPCLEIGLKPLIDWELTKEEKSKLESHSIDITKIPLHGHQFCNLTTINGGLITSPRIFNQASLLAAIIGTLQAAYTDIPYLGPITELINKKDALLGVSICGIMDSPKVLLNPLVLKNAAHLCRRVNAALAKSIGINPAARITAVKPEGTTSLLLNAGSGIHPHHARHYFRRVQANKQEHLYKHIAEINPQMVEQSVYNEQSGVITFPVSARPDAVLRSTISALRFLENVKLVQQNWVLEGKNPNRDPGINHNVSNTCTVKDTEWDAVAEYIWSNREFFTGVSLLRDSGDKQYAQAPREEVVTAADIAKWNLLDPKPVDFSKVVETEDNTNLKAIVACAGGMCELV